MKTKQAVGAIAMAAILILAGCSSAVPGAGTQAPTNDDTESLDGDSAEMTFYISDRPGAIEDFEHLNVTITKVGLHKAGADDGDDGDDAEEANETDSETDSEDESIVADEDATTTVEEPNETTVEMTTTEDDENETETEEPAETETEEPEETESEDESDEADAEDDESESKAGWVEHDVDNQTVDLTKLQGANATAIANLSVPEGDYDKVFVYVSEINATLKNGESVNVKLPSEKLQIKKDFSVSANESPDFVFDINVHKAGNSGKYILRPIVSESGTGDQVEIKEVDKDGKPVDAGANGKDKGDDGDDAEDKGDDGDDAEDESESSLEGSLDGEVRAGESVTLTVTNESGSVAGATVTVNGETVGETAADGTVTFEVPDSEELEVTVTTADAELELDWDVKGSGNGPNDESIQGYALA